MAMARPTVTTVITVLLVLVLAIGWFWLFELKPGIEERTSHAAGENPLLAAERWLQRHGHPTRTIESLERVQPGKSRGVLLLQVGERGDWDANDVEQVLAWVRAGNVLIIEPQHMVNAEGVDLDIEEDSGHRPLDKALGLELQYLTHEQSEAKRDHVTLRLPGIAWPLQIDPSSSVIRTPKRRILLARDDGAHGPRVVLFAEGRGQVAALATPRWAERSLLFNEVFERRDHAELLLHLVNRAGPGAPVMILRGHKATTWYEMLWKRAPYGIASIAAVLVLWLWRGLPSFGPMLPDAVPERRALIEHIDASGRWLWRHDAGRDALLTAARAAVRRLMDRRDPLLLRLSGADQIVRISDATGLPSAAVQMALFAPVQVVPAAFTRQIHLLQALRKHYERSDSHQ